MGFRRKLLNSLDDFAGGFSSESYACEIATLNQAQLTALHKRMLQKLLVTMALAAISIAGASATVGVSAVIGSAVAARRFHLNCQRILVVEARLREEGWDGHNFRKRGICWWRSGRALRPGRCFLVQGMSSVTSLTLAMRQPTMQSIR